MNLDPTNEDGKTTAILIVGEEYQAMIGSSTKEVQNKELIVSKRENDFTLVVK
ncbi:hypothetical protein [Virgibacillus salexigens]|uniref:Uncharacterized protein n=1 Tax=Virgibacillus kapii TaxID=1638645 RepID=A0ABQ2DUS3_9BACI|nr:hypothetical protein [Virgibacillus kapii]GGJ71084.1 hypothetical protein GCM10007111_35880 [Virgibacillus kapii]